MSKPIENLEWRRQYVDTVDELFHLMHKKFRNLVCAVQYHRDKKQWSIFSLTGEEIAAEKANGTKGFECL